MIINGTLIRTRRAELGYSARHVASQLGVTSSVINRLEAGDNHYDITVGLVARLAQLLAVDLPTLFSLEQEEPVSSDDVATLGALMLGVNIAMSVSAITESLDWPRQRTTDALEQLGAALETVGMRLSRNGNGYGIVRAVEPFDRDALAALLRAHINRDGLNRTEASMLRRIATTGAPKQPSNPEAVAIGALVNAGLIEPGTPATRGGEAPLVLSEAAGFSLLLD